MRFFGYFAISLVSLETLLFLTTATYAADADTSADTHPVLQGTVQDKAKMEASVKLLVAPPPAPKPLPTLSPPSLQGSLEKSSGAGQFSWKILAPTVPMIVPHSHAPH